MDAEDGSGLQSPLFYFANKIYFTTYNSLTVLDASSGKRLARLSFPILESGLFSSLTPDIFYIQGDKVFLARECGAVYCLSNNTNELLWKHVLDWNYEMFFNTTQINKDLKGVLNEKAYSEKITKESAAWWSMHINSMDYQSRYGGGKQIGDKDYGYLEKSGPIGTRSFDASMMLFQSVLGLSESIAHSMKVAAEEAWQSD